MYALDTPRRRTFQCIAFLFLLCAAAYVSAASFMGHQPGEKISPMAGSYRSDQRGRMRFGYHELPVCKSSTAAHEDVDNDEHLSDLLAGRRLVPTAYEFAVGVDVACARLCEEDFSQEEVRRTNYMIENRYSTRLFLDDVEAVSTVERENNTSEQLLHRRGYLIGPPPIVTTGDDEPHILHNHLNFTIRYSTQRGGGVDVVAFHVEPNSTAKVDVCTTVSFVASPAPMLLPIDVDKKEATVLYTYSVHWEESDVPYALARTAAEEAQKHGHRTAAVHVVIATVLASVVVAFVMLRTVRKDLAMYVGSGADEMELREESGWKLVRGDVFRPPAYASMLSMLVGTGCQIVVTVLVTMLLCVGHSIDATRRGVFFRSFCSVLLVSHAIAGFAVARLLRLFGTGSRRKALACTAAFPLLLSCGFVGFSFLQSIRHPSAASSLLWSVIVAAFWFAASVVLGGFGVIVGWRREAVILPIKVNVVPRPISEAAQKRTGYYILFGSLVPFIAGCVEMAFALNAFWREEQMLMFGLLTFFLCTLALLCAEVGIVVTYFTLRDEDYRWWWRSFGSLAMTGVYVFGYSVFKLPSLELYHASSALLYLSLMLTVSALFGLGLGSIGFLGSLWLVQRMYSAMKAD